MGFPKALLRYRDETFLDTLIGHLRRALRPVIVVLGAHADRIREAPSGRPRFVINPDYQRGQTTSMQCGLRAVPAGAEGVLFTLVDHPAVAPATLTRCWPGLAPLVRVPRYQGQRGHPIWFAPRTHRRVSGAPRKRRRPRYRAQSRRRDRVPGRGRPRHRGRHRRSRGLPPPHRSCSYEVRRPAVQDARHPAAACS